MNLFLLLPLLSAHCITRTHINASLPFHCWVTALLIDATDVHSQINNPPPLPTLTATDHEKAAAVCPESHFPHLALRVEVWTEMNYRLPHRALFLSPHAAVLASDCVKTAGHLVMTSYAIKFQVVARSWPFVMCCWKKIKGKKKKEKKKKPQVIKSSALERLSHRI